VYAIVGVLRVERVIDAIAFPEEEWHRNAHTRRVLKSYADEVIVLGSRSGSGRLTQAITIGEYRGRAYRVTEKLLRAWEGLTVNDGYLQRSANFPFITKPIEFMRWWMNQNPTLIATNNTTVQQ
jgi:hypothetical protein